jgi:hypothetical protein
VNAEITGGAFTSTVASPPGHCAIKISTWDPASGQARRNQAALKVARAG